MAKATGISLGSVQRIWRAHKLQPHRLPARGGLAGMTMSQNPYRGFRFPPEVIEHAVWLYHCFSLSLRDVELMLAARGAVVSYESNFGRILANKAEVVPAPTGRQVVHGRGVHPHLRQAALSLAHR
jgi:hypothetical protein